MRSHRHITKTLSIALVAGMATAVYAGPGSTDTSHGSDHKGHDKTSMRDTQHSQRDHTPRTEARSAERSLAINNFKRASDLLGSDLENTQGESLATIEDFIFERGSGRIEQVVLRTGAILGFGGKEIAVPYDALTFNTTDDVYWTRMTKSQIENEAKFVPENWIELDGQAWSGESNWIDDLFGTDDNAEPDNWAERVADADTEEIEGEIIDVRKNDWIEGSEYVTLVLATGDGETRTIVAGPSWYVSGMDDAPQRGDTIHATVAVIDTGNAATQYTLVESTVDGKTTEFRNKKGQGAWHLNPEGHNVPARRLVLMSDLVGANAEALGQESMGEIQDVVLETNSGKIAFVGFDPNENILGLGDDILAIPWDLVNLTGSDEARIVASGANMEKAVVLPDDVSDLSSSTTLRSMYSPFNLEPDTFEQAKGWEYSNTKPRGG